MQGSIVKRGSRYYFVYYKKNAADKKQAWIGFDTKKEAEAYKRNFNKKKELGIVEAPHIKLKNYLRNWFSVYAERNELSKNTISGYKVNIYNHIIPSIGDYYIDEISAAVLDSLFDDMKNKNLSGTTQLYAYRVLHKAFESGVKRRELPFNYCDMIDPPRKSKHKNKYLVEDSMHGYIEYLKDFDIRYSLPILFAASLGLRRGEILGLKWSDFDFNAATPFVHIQRSANIAKGGYYFSDCKTDKSNRVLLIPDLLYSKILEWQEVQKEFNSFSPDGFVFCQSNNKLLSANTLNTVFKKTLIACNLPDMRLHDLRHSFASYLVNSNSVPVNVVSSIMGHSKISTTLDLYTHSDIDMQKKAISELNRIS